MRGQFRPIWWKSKNVNNSDRAFSPCCLNFTWNPNPKLPHHLQNFHPTADAPQLFVKYDSPTYIWSKFTLMLLLGIKLRESPPRRVQSKYCSWIKVFCFCQQSLLTFDFSLESLINLQLNEIGSSSMLNAHSCKFVFNNSLREIAGVGEGGRGVYSRQVWGFA